MVESVTPFLMFEGHAEEAMAFYASVLGDAEILSISRYGAGEGGPEGSVMQARFAIKGQEILVIDSPAKHAFTFTPAFSLFVACESDAEIDRVFAALSEGGEIMMPLGAYPFAARFGWLSDRFGVSWQLSRSPSAP